MKIYLEGIKDDHCYGEPFVTKGNKYEIVNESIEDYVILDDSGYENRLSKSKCDHNFYGNWFEFKSDNEYERGMLYDIVLKSGTELHCYTKQDSGEIMGHWLQDDILIVQENAETDKTTVLKIEDVDYIRFDKENLDNPI